VLYPLSYEGGALLKPSQQTSLEGSCNPRSNEALLGRPTGTGYWTRESISRMAATVRRRRSP
jgi:hypothetical protein